MRPRAPRAHARVGDGPIGGEAEDSAAATARSGVLGAAIQARLDRGDADGAKALFARVGEQLDRAHAAPIKVQLPVSKFSKNEDMMSIRYHECPTMISETRRREIASHFSMLDFNGKIAFLANIAEWLTLDGRAIEEPNAQDEAAKMRIVIEVLHRVVVQLHRMLTSDVRYPDEVFADVLVDQLERLKLSDAAIRRMIP